MSFYMELEGTLSYPTADIFNAKVDMLKQLGCIREDCENENGYVFLDESGMAISNSDMSDIYMNDDYLITFPAWSYRNYTKILDELIKDAEVIDVEYTSTDGTCMVGWVKKSQDDEIIDVCASDERLLPLLRVAYQNDMESLKAAEDFIEMDCDQYEEAHEVDWYEDAHYFLSDALRQLKVINTKAA